MKPNQIAIQQKKLMQSQLKLHLKKLHLKIKLLVYKHLIYNNHPRRRKRQAPADLTLSQKATSNGTNLIENTKKQKVAKLPVILKLNKISRSGSVKIGFNQKLKIPKKFRNKAKR